MTIPIRSQVAAASGEHRPKPLKRVLLPLIAIVVALSVTLLTVFLMQHGQDDSEVETTPQSIWSVFDAVSVSGRVGAVPVVAVNGQINVNAMKSRVLASGSGRTITQDAPVLLSVTAFDGDDGTNLSPQGRPQLMVGRADADTVGQDILNLVVGQAEGARILVVRPIAPEQGAQGSSSSVEIDVIDILASIAYGDEVTGEQAGSLQVTMRDEGPVIKHDEQVPGGLTVQTLISGAGGQVLETDLVVAQFSVVGWNDGVVRASTWQTGIPELVDMNTAMVGLRQALVDQRVGSRLAISIPPDMAEGDDTLCVVIDILGTQPSTVSQPEQDFPQSQSGTSDENTKQSG
ncbi:FKBP-type peptidyl-prolyl cis-trans isomerase [Schaalia vaccimaxillae]|uniref:FKBP-type peptidyl-prolyl cis-trans isomerase n=1 Tax=Schaalia vaccimaxillae TaxID=183916 RepID=UPI0003B76838|nr:hypothetical protein [Schaalia vaccimaxillae]